MNNEELKTILNNLLPDELELINKFIREILGIKVNRTITNHKYVSKKELLCPSCKSKNYKKNGHNNDKQRYLCRDCKTSFTDSSDTLVNYSKLNYDQIIKIIECIINKNTIRDISELVEINKRTAYEIRIKIINVLNKLNENTKLKGIVEADEKYFRLNLKGTKTINMPRKSRKSGKQDLTPGISKEQVCVVTAIDENDNIVIKVVGNGNVSTEMISIALKDKIEKGSILITDSKSSYIKFAKSNDLILKQIPVASHTVEGIYNLANLNSLHSELEIFMSSFRGVSVRHLQQYLDWFRYQKILKYTVELLKRKMNIYRFSINQNNSLRQSNLYTTEIPVDLDKIYPK